MSHTLVNTPITDVAALLPHSGQMVLLEQILDYNDNELIARTHLHPSCPLIQADGTIPAWMGMELLAQSVGALNGIQAQQAGEKVNIGFLLGTRKLSLLASHLPLQQSLIAQVHLSIRDTNGFAVFDSRLYQAEKPLAWHETPDNLLIQAALNLFRPKDNTLLEKNA